MKKLPLGIQSFRKIIEGSYVYIDKTQYIYDLINGASYYFLSRPRRFGKSLFLDAIGEVFSGDKELFKGLWIYNSGHDFEKHPVLHLDMSNISNETPEILKESLAVNLKKRIKEENLDITCEIPSDMFKTLLEALHNKYNQRVVVLIDEYDKPILDHVDDIEVAEANRKVLRGFFGILKSMDPYLRFTFITGVTKFTKASIFSELNNLLDITLTEEYANICGVAIEELDKYFSEHIKSLSTLNKFKQYDSLHDEILAWYDGYSWNGEARVINPFSLLSFFIQKKFSSFWYASGSPKFLMDLMKKKPASYTNLINLTIGEWALDTFDLKKIEVEPLLFQTGYLTVKEVLHSSGSPAYLLGIPNFEVREAFNLHIVAEFTETGGTFTESAYHQISESLRTGDLQKMLDILRTLFASIPYQLHIDRESYYHSIFYAIMSVLGFDMDVETPTAKGRIDAVLNLDDKVYIMEFKYEECPKEASSGEKQKLFEKALEDGMAQIKDRGYAKKYAEGGKAIYQASFAFLGKDEIEMRIEKFPQQIPGAVSGESKYEAALWEQFEEFGFPVCTQCRYKQFSRSKKTLEHADAYIETDKLTIPISILTDLSVVDVDDHLRRLERIRKNMDSRGETNKLVGAIAGLRVPEFVRKYAHKKGLYVIIESDDSATLAELPEGFEAREW